MRFKPGDRAFVGTNAEPGQVVELPPGSAELAELEALGREYVAFVFDHEMLPYYTVVPESDLRKE